MKEIFTQLKTIWFAIRPFQKIIVSCVLLFVIGILGCMIVNLDSDRLVPLSLHLSKPKSEDILHIKKYLEENGIPYYEDRNIGLLIPKDHYQKICNEMATICIAKQGPSQGFELFDTNTWIKGEKELQVLELRALKGQLEKDICEYENIKNANVILDLAPQKSFGASPYKTKASVILSLKYGTRLSASQLRAITSHLAGAVRGLETSRIAISDTSGKLYQTIESEGSEDKQKVNGLLLEDQIQNKIDGILKKTVGQDNYHIEVNALWNEEHAKLMSLGLSILINEKCVSESGDRKDLFLCDIKNNIEVFLKSYDAAINISVSSIPFAKKEEFSREAKKIPYVRLLFTLLILALAVVSIIPLFKHYQKKERLIRRNLPEESLTEMIMKINIKDLADSIRSEDPQTIALMLSYMEPAKAETILSSLPETLQSQIIDQLSEMEKEDAQ
jgi:flagellar M-ring protein FliF